MICPYGHQLLVDLRVNEEGTFNIKHGQIAIFNSKEEAESAVEKYKSNRP